MSRPANALARAIATWRKQPTRARKDALHFFRDEAAQSDDWARHEVEMGRDTGDECRRHREDARAIRASLALLLAAAKKPARRQSR
jgi:hypothetical protein